MTRDHWEKIFPAGSGYQSKDTDFTVRGCKKGTDVPPPAGLKAIDWQTDGAVVVKYVVHDYCVAPIHYGGYSVSDNVLNLNYRINWRTTFVRPKCTCAYELEYRIQNLPRKEYSVQVREGKSN